MGKGGLEQLWGAAIRGVFKAKVSSGGAKEFAGLTALASGSATITVSTTVIKSNSLILTGLQATAAVNSGYQKAIVVRSIVDATSFALSTADGDVPGQPLNISWMIVRQD